MVLGTLAPICKSTIYGLGFYQSFRYSRSLAVGWKEQRGLCTVDHIGNLAMMVITGYANMQAIKGTAFANRVWYMSYSTYALMPAMYFLMNRLEDSESLEKSYEDLCKLYPMQGEGDVHSLGQRVQEKEFIEGISKKVHEKYPKQGEKDPRPLEKRVLDYIKNLQSGYNWSPEYHELRRTYDSPNTDEELAKQIIQDESGGNGRLQALIRQFPKTDEKDTRNLGERLDAALVNHERSDLEKKCKELLDFMFLHIPDFVLLVSVIHTVAALRIGFNRAGNAVQLAFYGWAVAEQGLFWKTPEEDRGILMSAWDGDLVRAYNPTVSKISSYTGLPFNFFYKGILGKAQTLFNLLIRFASEEQLAELIPEPMKKNYRKMSEEIEQLERVEVSEKTKNNPQWIGGEYEIPFETLHFADGMREVMQGGNPNLFPNKTVEQLKQEVLHKVGNHGQKPKFKKMLNDLETFVEDRKQQKIQLKNILGTCVQLWDKAGMDMATMLPDLYDSKFRWGISEYSLHDFATIVTQFRLRITQEYLDDSLKHLMAFMPISDVQRFIPTDKLFEMFKLKDCFKEKTLKELELEAQKQLVSVQSGYDAEKVKKLQKLIGVDGNHGYLHQHVIACRETTEYAEKEMYLKNILGAILADWEGRYLYLVDREGDFLCRTATGSTLKQVAYELYPEIQKEEVKKKDEDGGERDARMTKNRVFSGIQLVLQQNRDLIFESVSQMLAYQLLKNQDEIEKGMAAERKRNFENLGNREEGGLWGQVKAYGLTGVQYAGVEFAKQTAMGIGTSRHTNNLVTYGFGKNLGLSHYPEACRDVEIQMQRRYIDLTVLDEGLKHVNRLTDILARKAILFGMKGYSEGSQENPSKKEMYMMELVHAIVHRGDTRIRFEDVRSYLISRYDELYPKAEVNPVELDAYKVSIPSDHLDVHKIEEAYVNYKREAEAFLFKYLPQVLYDFGFVTDKKPNA